MKDIGVVSTTEVMSTRGFDSPRLHSRECNSAVESRFSKPMVVGSNPIVRFMKSNDDIYYEVRIGTAMMVLTILTNLIHSGLLLFIFMYMAEKAK